MAGKALRWNDSGDGLVNTTIVIDTILPLAQAQADAAAASAATASAQAAASASARTAADADAAATAADRITVATDKAIVAVDKATVATDKAVTHTDRLAADASAAAAAASETAANADAIATAADRITVATDKAQVAADKATVASDKATAEASATAAAASASAAHDSEVAAAASAAAASAAAGGGAVKISATDTTADYLSASLAAGSNIALSVQSAGANESLQISVTGLAAVATSGAYADLSGKPTLGTAAALDVDTDTTLAADSDVKLASQKAVRAFVAAQIAAGSGPDPYPDIGQLYLGLARLDTPTSPNAGGTQVADEFDSSSGIGSLGSGVVASGYLSNPGGATTSYANAGGTGNRTGSITVTTYTSNGYNFTSGGAASTVVDGTTTGSTGPSFGGGSVDPVGDYIRFYFGSGSGKIINETKFYLNDTGTYAVWKWQGSNNGSSWTDLTSGFTVGGATTWTDTSLSANTTPYDYYQLIGVSGNQGTQRNLNEIEFKIGVVTSPANITTVSNAYTAASAPSTVSLVVEYQDISTTAVVGTDITFEVSRDNGTTWTAVTMTDFGPGIISSSRVLKGSVSVAGQPSGTNIKWRVKTFNAKEQRVHGLWMQWK